MMYEGVHHEDAQTCDKHGHHKWLAGGVRARACWEARMALREHAQVVHQLERWWTLATDSFMVRRADDSQQQGAGSDLMPPSNGVAFEHYAQLQASIHKRHVQPFDAENALRCAQADWQTDSKGAPLLGRALFLDSLFEICDAFVTRADASQYASWLNSTLQAISVKRGSVALVRSVASNGARYTLSSDGADTTIVLRQHAFISPVSPPRGATLARRRRNMAVPRHRSPRSAGGAGFAQQASPIHSTTANIATASEVTGEVAGNAAGAEMRAASTLAPSCIPSSCPPRVATPGLPLALPLTPRLTPRSFLSTGRASGPYAVPRPTWRSNERSSWEADAVAGAINARARQAADPGREARKKIIFNSIASAGSGSTKSVTAAVGTEDLPAAMLLGSSLKVHRGDFVPHKPLSLPQSPRGMGGIPGLTLTQGQGQWSPRHKRPATHTRSLLIVGAGSSNSLEEERASSRPSTRAFTMEAMPAGSGTRARPTGTPSSPRSVGRAIELAGKPSVWSEIVPSHAPGGSSGIHAPLPTGDY
jgi:hypothetical protein